MDKLEKLVTPVGKKCNDIIEVQQKIDDRGTSMFDHYIGLDWAQSIMAVARTTKMGKKLQPTIFKSRYLSTLLNSEWLNLP